METFSICCVCVFLLFFSSLFFHTHALNVYVLLKVAYVLIPTIGGGATVRGSAGTSIAAFKISIYSSAPIVIQQKHGVKC